MLSNRKSEIRYERPRPKSEILGFAWLAEQASLWQAHIGNDRWADQLARDPEAFRELAARRGTDMAALRLSV